MVSAPVVQVSAVRKTYGRTVAVDEVSFDVYQGEIFGLIGPNGAGKTTLFNCLSRLYECDRGEIVFDSHSLLRVPRHGIAALGIGRTFQNLALFRTMSVLDNVMVGCHCRTRTGFARNALRTPMVGAEEQATRRKAAELIRLLELDAVADMAVADLPFGTQKRVELARALAAEPTLLLLDEPMAGMNVEEKQDMCRFILDVNEQYGTTIVLIEHDMGVVMDISDRVVVLDYGRKIGDGTPSEIRANQSVIDAYLGVARA
jgi:branched-chain amino acid transport system ATP-binding protein